MRTWVGIDSGFPLQPSGVREWGGVEDVIAFKKAWSLNDSGMFPLDQQPCRPHGANRARELMTDESLEDKMVGSEGIEPPTNSV